LPAAGVGAAAAPTLGATALAQSGGVTDVDILNLALTAEFLAVDVYTNSLLASFPGGNRDYLQEALRQEETHVKALRDTIAALGGHVRALPAGVCVLPVPTKPRCWKP
jgi:hypothetical protein